jgi:uncharacterized membrane protein (DUF2068 family)
LPDSPAVSSAPLRALALFEGAKGMLVIVAGIGILKWPRPLETAAEAVIAHLHLNPAKHEVLIFALVAAGGSSRLWWLALGAAVYAVGRLGESVGLWLGKRWAIWLAIGTAAIYIPFELAALARRPTALALVALAVNAAVLLYLFRRHVQPPAGVAVV